MVGVIFPMENGNARDAVIWLTILDSLVASPANSRGAGRSSVRTL